VTTIYLTNAATVSVVGRGIARPETAAAVGPGPVLSIMRFPRADYGEAGEGRVLAFTPPKTLATPAIEARRMYDAEGTNASADAWRAYEAALVGLWSPRLAAAAPGRLGYGIRVEPYEKGSMAWDGDVWVQAGVVPDGATLVCACSRSAAADRRCHRVVAADVLRRAGWRVVLDGKET